MRNQHREILQAPLRRFRKPPDKSKQSIVSLQILCEAGLLPGALVRNRSLQFRCEHVHLRTVTSRSPFTGGVPEGKVLRIPIAHGEGCYYVDRFGAPKSHPALSDERNGRVTFARLLRELNLSEEAPETRLPGLEY